MLYQWTCNASDQSYFYNDLTARQLKELADARRITPLDSVGIGVLDYAYKLRGLFDDATILHTTWPGVRDGSGWNRSVKVWVNRHFVGERSFASSFRIAAEVEPGENEICVQLSGRGAKIYHLHLPSPNVYLFQLAMGLLGNFKAQGHLSWGRESEEEGNSVWRWAEEVRAAQCQHCHAAWTINHLGEHVVDRQQQSKMIRDVSTQTVLNPDFFYNTHPYSMPLPVKNQLVDGWRPVSVIVETIEDVFQCAHCSAQWTEQRVVQRS